MTIADIAGMTVNTAGMMDTGFTTILIIVSLGCLLGLGAFIWHFTRYKHKFRIKKITGTKTIVLDDKAKEFRDKDGITWWKLLKHKHVIAVPPADCLDVTDKGKHSVEAYYSDESGYQFEKSAKGSDISPYIIKDLGIAFKIPFIKKKLVLFNWTVKEKKSYDHKRAKFVFIEDASPSTKGTDVLKTKQKVIMVNQLIKAKARKGTNWREHIPLIVGATAMVLLVAVVFIFFDNIVEPIEPLISQLAATEKSQKETVMILQEMIQKKQIIPAGMVVNAAPYQFNVTGPPPG